MRSKTVLGLVSGLVVLGGVGASRPAWASGYVLYEASPTGMAQGGAMIADASEAATIFYNPAGMTRLRGFEAQASLVTYYAAPATFRSGTTGIKEKSDSGAFLLPTLFANYKVNDWLAFGVGGYSAYGLGISWPAGWSGYGLVKKAELQSYSIQPSVAVGPWKGVSFGAGVDILLGAVDISRGIPFTDGKYGELRLGGSASAVGFNAGVLYEPADWVKLGLTFRSSIKISLNDGKADFTVPAPFQEALRDQGMRTSLTTPPIAGFGARFQPIKPLKLELDLMYIGWSVYDQLNFQFDNASLNSPQDKNWKDAFQIRTGGQYDIGDGALRAGFIFDKNPVPDRTLDPLLPDSDRFDFSVGGGYSFGKVRVDGAYMFVYFLPRTVGDVNPFPGTYNVTAHVFSLGASIKL